MSKYYKKINLLRKLNYMYIYIYIYTGSLVILCIISVLIDTIGIIEINFNIPYDTLSVLFPSSY